jgi:hypothetical protein
MASVLKVDKLDPQSGTDLEIGTSGDTITVPSGATFTVSGTMNASSITAGTVATARLGTGSASSSVFLAGDSTWIAAGGGAFGSETFGARMDTLRTFTSGSDNTIIFETELWDSDTAYNTTTGIYTIPTAGSYLFGGMVKFHETASTFTSCTLYFNVAGVQKQVAQWYDSGGGDVSQLILNFSVPNPSLSVSDDVYMQAAATTFDSSTYNLPSSGYSTVFWGARIA